MATQIAYDYSDDEFEAEVQKQAKLKFLVESRPNKCLVDTGHSFILADGVEYILGRADVGPADQAQARKVLLKSRVTDENAPESAVEAATVQR